jgi:predicted transcriptional regulator
MQNMAAKGIVRRDENQRAHIYIASRPEEQTKRQLVRDLLQRAFEGSASQLMAHALDGRRPSRKELEEIRNILQPYEDKGND